MTVVESSHSSVVDDDDEEEVLVDLVVDELLVWWLDEDDVLVDVEVEVWQPVAVTTAQLVAQPRPLHCSWHGKDV